VKRLQLLILVFFIVLSVPLGYFVFQTYRGLKQEEVAELRYFAETLFDKMEEELAILVIKEETRAIDEYRPPSAGQGLGLTDESLSPLSELPREPYILGYLQNNPDGSFQTPLVAKEESVPRNRAVMKQLQEANALFNQKRTSIPEPIVVQPTEEVFAKTVEKQSPRFAEKYLDMSRTTKQKAYLGQIKPRVEHIAPSQALTLAQREERQVLDEGRYHAHIEAEPDHALGAADQVGSEDDEKKEQFKDGEYPADTELGVQPQPYGDKEKLRVEVDPLQAALLSDNEVLIFRRIVIDNQVFRQGFVIVVKQLLEHLTNTYFTKQPLARFTSLRLRAMSQGREAAALLAGKAVTYPNFSLNRIFPRPFSFLHATLSCEQIPRSAGRRTLGIMIAMLAATILMGLLAMYQSVRGLVALSERRSKFVSSVTHELKTPLTNIRMYIEMLEQGIARDPEREQDYFRILGSESTRLSRLINNVLEFSKLEKKQRHLDLQVGSFEEVIQEVTDVMQPKLQQDGFTLKVEKQEIRPFKYDREVMVQILVNLIENSMKFGKFAPQKEITVRIRPENNRMKISVADTGPGIPPQDLKRVFDDFYRVDSTLSRATGGSGLGLAIVKKFVVAMGGSVTARNNDGPGCMITITLPL